MERVLIISDKNNKTEYLWIIVNNEKINIVKRGKFLKIVTYPNMKTFTTSEAIFRGVFVEIDHF